MTERRDILNTAAAHVPSGKAKQLPASVLEKDVWVCWVLRVLFSFEDGKEFAFKGGTSLSKVFDLIGRFSEDIDITIDYRSMKPLGNPLDPSLSRTRREKIVDDLRSRAQEYVDAQVLPRLDHEVRNAVASGESCSVRPGDEEGSLEVLFPSALGAADAYYGPPDSMWFPGPGEERYVPGRVLIEFGGRNTTEPKERHTIEPYLKSFTRNLDFPIAQVDVLSPKRTFWEKVTLIHAELGKKAFKKTLERKARHWYDVAILADSEVGTAALADRGLLKSVVRHKEVFFSGSYCEYDKCLSGQLRLIPDGDRLKVLEDDYEEMIGAGMFFKEPPEFPQILGRLRTLQDKINSRG